MANGEHTNFCAEILNCLEAEGKVIQEEQQQQGGLGILNPLLAAGGGYATAVWANPILGAVVWGGISFLDWLSQNVPTWQAEWQKRWEEQQAENLRLYDEMSRNASETYEFVRQKEGLTTDEQVKEVFYELYFHEGFGDLVPQFSSPEERDAYFEGYEAEFTTLVRDMLMNNPDFYAQVKREAADAAEQRADELETRAVDSAQFLSDLEAQPGADLQTWYDPITTFGDLATEDAENARQAREDANRARRRAIFAANDARLAEEVAGLPPFVSEQPLGAFEQMRLDIDSFKTAISTIEPIRTELDALKGTIASINVDGRLQTLQSQINLIFSEIGNLKANFASSRTADSDAINRPPGSGVPGASGWR